MRHVRSIVALLLLPFAFAARAIADGPEVPPVQPNDLVRKLGDASFRVRESAERELVRRGAAVLAEVKRGAEDSDLEIRRRSQSVLAEIQRSAIDVSLEAFMAGKEDAKMSLPGWNAVRQTMGDDAASRYLYVLFYKSDLSLLDVLERNPKALAEQLESRMQQLQPKLNLGIRSSRAADATVEEIAAVLLIATAEQTKLNSPTPPKSGGRISRIANTNDNRLMNLLSQQSVQRCLQWSQAARRLTEKYLAQRCDDPDLGSQVCYLATIYGCTELIETRLRPATEKALVAAAANLTDFNTFYRALNQLNQAQQCRMTDLIDATLKPAVRNALQAATRDPVDANRLNQLATCAQQIGGMEAELKPVLRPVLTQLAKKQAEKMNDVSRFYAIINLARFSQNEDVLDDILRPAFRFSLLQLTIAPHTDTGPLMNAYNQAQTLGMQEEIESLLKPAAESLIQTLVAKKNDPVRWQQALAMAQTFQLKESLRPIVQILVDDATGAAPDIDRIFTVIQFARVVALPEIDQVIEKQLKPAARKALLAATDQPLNFATISQTFTVAEQLQLKEIVPLALKSVQAKKAPPHVQSQAIFLVGRHGGPDAIPHIEALLGDKTILGAAGINGMSTQSQVGDMALAALIQLSGQKFEAYDFPWARVVGQGANQTLQSAPHYYGFENEAARQAAQKKWRDSRTK